MCGCFECDQMGRKVAPLHGILESAVRIDLWLQKDVNTRQKWAVGS